MFFIYKITNLINKKIYIGKTDDVNDRWNAHKYAAKKQNPKDYSYIHRAISKYGSENFKIEIIFECNNEQEALQLEKDFIKKFNSINRDIGYNLTEGGEGSSGYKHTEEAKQLMSLQRIGKMAGENHPLFGTLRSQETKNKISKANSGRILTNEHKEKISKSNIGKKVSDATRKKISEYHLGKTLSEDTKIKISESMKLLWNNEEYKKNISISKIGKKQSKDSVLKRSGENSKVSKLEKYQVLEIIEKYNTGNYTHRSLGKEYKVSHRQIGYILSGKSWKNIKE